MKKGRCFTEQKEELVEDKIVSGCGCSNHDIVEIRIPRGGNEASKQNRNPLTSGEKAFACSEDCLEESHEIVPESRGVQESWLILLAIVRYRGS